jgi:hypothetical protein
MHKYRKIIAISLGAALAAALLPGVAPGVTSRREKWVLCAGVFLCVHQSIHSYSEAL